MNNLISNNMDNKRNCLKPFEAYTDFNNTYVYENIHHITYIYIYIPLLYYRLCIELMSGPVAKLKHGMIYILLFYSI